jgi:hypothetical protein
MKKRLYYIILLELLIVLVLTTAWEFWLEDFTFGVLNIEHAEEGLTERLEYIITSSVFVCIALVIPLWIIVREIILRPWKVCSPCAPTAKIFVMMTGTGNRLKYISGSIRKRNSVIVFVQNVPTSFIRTYSIK